VTGRFYPGFLIGSHFSAVRQLVLRCDRCVLKDYGYVLVTYCHFDYGSSSDCDSCYACGDDCGCGDDVVCCDFDFDYVIDVCVGDCETWNEISIWIVNMTWTRNKYTGAKIVTVTIKIFNN